MTRGRDIAWAPEAAQALKGVPVLVRPLARRKVEDRVRSEGRDQVSLADFAAAEARFRAVMGAKSDKELAQLMPAANRPGVELVVLESCRAKLSGCPNAIMDTDPWREALEQWLAANQVSERLRAKVEGDQVLFHHKLRLSLAGCPNGCSRPQIADLALVGTVSPIFDPADCTACGACAAGCPDGAIAVAETASWDLDQCLGCLGCATCCPTGAVSLGPVEARVLMGGKLGRHPHLAREVARVGSPEQAVALMGRAIDDYIENAPQGERFAAWWAAKHKEGE
ncbi:MAG: 4Fe-4S binding protein [Desulfarculaceae bacterium]|nr:4Fe-4S binding protein [Desulfarculaceae bacterium]MCF8048898.1 4Fe-4S binding protein [Desulfarculaceae bacterium]MCF8097206.1 4Fe-4S binding protein [Desulfarculaceae bacterium]MCF8122751.1 4Fe-4S binding protein [Desulfarculaceae bacterium]